jgi:hypothetical protein
MEGGAVLLFAVVWLLLYWLGSLALEATGMERSKARFQALSAITGTGFTTREAESVVNHPKRRRIVSWLIVIGTTGLITLLVGLLVIVRTGVEAPSTLFLIVVIGVIALVVVIILIGIVSRLSDLILRFLRIGPGRTWLADKEILVQTGPYVVVRIKPDEKMVKPGMKIGDSGLMEEGMTILAIERKDTVLSLPGTDEQVQAGDRLLCYGEVGKISGVGE